MQQAATFAFACGGKLKLMSNFFTTCAIINLSISIFLVLPIQTVLGFLFAALISLTSEPANYCFMSRNPELVNPTQTSAVNNYRKCEENAGKRGHCVPFPPEKRKL